MNCYELFLQKFNKQGEIVFYNHRTKLSKIQKDIDGMCGSFEEMGLSKGDVVSLYLPTCPQSIVLFYACSKSGIIANFIHPRMSIDQVCQNVEKTKSQILFFYDALVEDEKELQLKTNQRLVRCSVADYETLLKPFFYLYSKRKCKRISQTLAFKNLTECKKETKIIGTEKDVVCYMHSGGTSGDPKIVKLTNESFNYVATTIGRLHNQADTNGKFALVTLPVFHAYGLCASIHAPLLLGYGLALVPKFNIKQVNAYLNWLNVGLWLAVPTMLRKMIEKNSLNARGLKNIQDLWCGGDFVDETLLANVNKILKKKGSTGAALRGYGLTETCGPCTVSTQINLKKGSSGRAIDGTEIAIVDEDNNPLSYNQVGEIVIQSPAIAEGYLDGERLDGFLKTGDMGYIDEDGYVFVVDRKKRIIKISAVNVFPSEIEKTICEIPHVRQCCVVGYKERGKQYLRAYIVTDSENKEDVASEVKSICLNKLSQYCVPQSIEFIEKMPLTSLGKTDYLKLQKIANESEVCRIK